MEKGRVRVFPLIEYYRYSSIFSVCTHFQSQLLLSTNFGLYCFLVCQYFIVCTIYICLNIHIYQVYIPPVWRLKKTRWTTTQQATSRNHPNTENIYPTHKAPNTKPNNETSFPFGEILNRRLCLLAWPDLRVWASFYTKLVLKISENIIIGN